MLHVLLQPLGVPSMPPPRCFRQSPSRNSEGCRGLSTIDVGNATQGQGVPDHQMLPIGGMQLFQARCFSGESGGLQGAFTSGIGTPRSRMCTCAPRGTAFAHMNLVKICTKGQQAHGHHGHLGTPKPRGGGGALGPGRWKPPPSYPKTRDWGGSHTRTVPGCPAPRPGTKALYPCGGTRWCGPRRFIGGFMGSSPLLG